MDRLKAMNTFCRVVERGSFVAAAGELGYSHGMASAIVKELERHLGTQLLRRTTRRLALTEEGRRYFEACRAILADVAEIEDEIGSAATLPRGRLRVQVPVGLARMVIAPEMPAFLRPFPGLSLHLLARHRLPDFVADNLDAAIFIGEVPERDIVARPLGRIPFLTCASPQYLAAHPAPRRPEDLAGHNCIGILSSQTGRELEWRFERDGRYVPLQVKGNMSFEGSEPAVAAAVAGGGMLQMIAFLVAEDIRARRLRPVLTDWLYPGATINLLYPRQSRMSRKLRLFESFVRSAIRAYSRRWSLEGIATIMAEAAPDDAPVAGAD